MIALYKRNTKKSKWNNLTLNCAKTDIESFFFHSSFLAYFEHVLHYGKKGIKDLIQVDPASISTDGHTIRFYHIGFKGGSFGALIRNQNHFKGDRLSVVVSQNCQLLPGDFVDFPPREYSSLGGLRADIFTIQDNTFTSACLGTGSFHRYTSDETTFYHLKDTQLYYANIKLFNRSQYAFVLEIRSSAQQEHKNRFTKQALQV